MKKVLALSLLISLLTLAALHIAWSDGSKLANAMQQRVSLNAVNMPLPDALDIIFKDSDVKYILDPSLGNLKVTLTIQSTPRLQAIVAIVRATGAAYLIGDGFIRIVKIPELPSTPPAQAAVSGRVEMAPKNIPPTHPEYFKAVTEKVILNYAEPSVVIPMLQLQREVQVLSSGSDFVVISGTEDAIKNAKSTIRMIDTPDALSLAVRVKLAVKVTVTENGKQPQTYESSTESVGAEGVPMPLDISAVKVIGETKVFQLKATLTPTITSKALLGNNKPGQEKSVSLTGSGEVKGPVPFQFSKQFDVAVAADPKEKVVIAAGNVDWSDNGKVEFEVSATVLNIETGRVRTPKQQQGYGGFSGSYGGGKSW